MEIRWEHFYAGYPGTEELTLPEAKRIVRIMLMTGRVHHRDFPRGMARRLMRKVNEKRGIRIRTGTHADSEEEVAIIYHRLRHFAANVRWSVSVGMHPDVTPYERIGLTDLTNPDEPYVKLAIAINNQLLNDVNFNLEDADALIVYDDVHPPTAGGTGLAAEAERRRTGIGELGWVAQHLPAVTATWKSIVPQMVPRPRKDGNLIKGWGRDGDTHIIRTVLKPN